ncbi:hypothetical protein [Nocardia thailandica]|uniref:hypothetical protein n=1 Tax=Nocardia thailandica TaxID=257275 RepID=UPI0005B98C3F|nr:hypothetical protein [Nocardia thailandica]
MSTVRAGVVPARRSLGYVLIGLGVTTAVVGMFLALFGVDRVVTGLLVGVIAGVAAGAALFARDVVELGEHAIHIRTPFRAATIAWERVVGGRFALDEHDRWSLALDLTGAGDHGDELVLLSIPPVHGPVTGAYDMRKREQVLQIRELLRTKRIPVTVLPGIAEALHEHWRIAPPTSR